MGLDIRVTYKKMSNGEELDCKYFNGRFMFNCVRNWVGNDRYGRNILLMPHSDDYMSLETALINEVAARRKESGEKDFDYEMPLMQLIKLVAEAPLLAEVGVSMYLECDW